MRVKKYIIYDISNGRIKRILQSDTANIRENIFSDEEGFIEGHARILDDFVSDGKITPRPGQETTLSGQTLKNLPVPCVVKINCTEYPCHNRTEDIEFDQPGVYRIRVSAWPYRDKEFVYEYTPS